MEYKGRYKKYYYKGSNHAPLTMNPAPKVAVNALRYDHKDLCDVAPAGSTKDFESRGGYRRSQPKNRGRLSPLMSEETKATATIHELSYDFASRITRLFQYLTEDAEYKEYIQSKQIYRSGTSIGANIRESKHAQSDADFLSKMSIAYKEADETDYWLNLLHDNGYLNDDQFNSLEKDITRILKILTSIVKTVRTKLGLEKTVNRES